MTPFGVFYFILLLFYSFYIPTLCQIFSLDIAGLSCPSCNFNWPSTLEYGYAFIVDNQLPTTIDLSEANVNLVSFSSIAFNYNTYNSSDSTCSTSDFNNEYVFELYIYHRANILETWVRKGPQSGSIDPTRTRIDRITFDNQILLTTGHWYVGVRLSWSASSQECDC